jgi:outer membrane protein OmpA-like peptidoglycan-associated protein
MRVAEFKQMTFAIRGYPDDSGTAESRAALAESRAKAVMTYLTSSGTPAWRLKATRFGAEAAPSSKATSVNRPQPGRVEFVRTR